MSSGEGIMKISMVSWP